MVKVKKVVIVGGHGRVARLLTKRLLVASGAYNVTSIIRNPAHKDDIIRLGAIPVVLELDSDPVSSFAEVFEGTDVVYVAAGADIGDSDEQFRKADYEGAVKVYDAIEAVKGTKPRLVLVSGADIRDAEKVPAHYNEEDIKISTEARQNLPFWFKWRLEGDKALIRRAAFKWTIVRPGFLSDDKGVGKADIGRTHVAKAIAREDLAEVLYLLAEREDAAGLALDLVGGEEDLAQALDRFIRKGETDFPLP